jgi:ABC-type glycerol-3-phosphate transport system substrate-binding protein
MKKLALILLALSLVLSSVPVLAATDASTLDPKDVVINVLICTQNQNDDLANTYFADFASKHGITVNCELAPSTGYGDLLTLGLVEDNQAYDLIMCNSNHWGSMIDGDWIMPLDSFINAEAEAKTDWYNGIMTAALDACVVNDQRWSVAYSAGVGVLMYNKAIFDKYGITDIPKNMDEVIATAAKINDPANKVFGLAFRGGQERGIALPWLINWLYLGGEWYPEGHDSIAIFDTDIALKALNQLIQMYDYAPEGIQSYAYQEAMAAMQQGYAAMFVDAVTLGVNLLDPAQTELHDQFGFSALEGTYSWGDGWCFSVASRTKHPEWCWELIKVATSYDTALDQIMRGKAVSCYRNDVYANEEINKVVPADLSEAVSKSAPMASIVYWPLISQKGEITGAMIDAFYKAINKKITPEEALAEVQQITIDILERDGVQYKK